MKIIQLNIWQGRLIGQLEQFFELQNADILCLQEVHSCAQELPSMFDMFNSLEYLKAALDYPYIYFSPTISFDVMNQKVDMGNAIFSKFPLANEQTIFINGVYEYRQNVDPGKGNVRNVQICRVEPGHREPFWLANYHGYHDLNPLGTEVTMEKMQALAGVLKALEGPLVVCGDMNVVAESPAMRVFDGWLTSLTALNRVGSTLSMYGKVSDVACDHILINGLMPAKVFNVFQDNISDHLALIAEF